MKGPKQEDIDLMGRIVAFCYVKKQAKLDLQTGISRVSGSEMRRFKNSGSSLHTGIQLWWRVPHERIFIWWAEWTVICFLKKLAQLDLQTGISRASGSEMRRFKYLGSSLHTGLQLWWRVPNKKILIWCAKSAATCFVKKQAQLDLQTGISRASGSEFYELN